MSLCRFETRDLKNQVLQRQSCWFQTAKTKRQTDQATGWPESSLRPLLYLVLYETQRRRYTEPLLNRGKRRLLESMGVLLAGHSLGFFLKVTGPGVPNQ